MGLGGRGRRGGRRRAHHRARVRHHRQQHHVHVHRARVRRNRRRRVFGRARVTGSTGHSGATIPATNKSKCVIILIFSGVGFMIGGGLLLGNSDGLMVWGTVLMALGGICLFLFIVVACKMSCTPTQTVVERQPQLQGGSAPPGEVSNTNTPDIVYSDTPPVVFSIQSEVVVDTPTNGRSTGAANARNSTPSAFIDGDLANDPPPPSYHEVITSPEYATSNE